MKKLILMSMLAIFSMVASAQNFALVDMEYVLNNISNYTQANEQLSQVSKKVQEQIDVVNKEAANLYKDYQRDIATLTPDQKKKRQDAIMEKEKKAADLKMKYFGPQGELAKKREKMITPIQEVVYAAIKLISEKRGYSMVIDRSSQTAGIIYGSPTIDISNEVLLVLSGGAK
ncbi:membrane protein [Prevotella bivia DNF00320]|uniref:Membrane protein n=1 Tax=Prevotella bivia DNF00320 TaxID=1401068 RepID=A0A096AFQ1_9BACT|nr:OmpH family outer membrane protein [Prevotella bivia]KGF45958.1 membrane protein [Prevotella bivia DNF00320]